MRHARAGGQGCGIPDDMTPRDASSILPLKRVGCEEVHSAARPNPRGKPRFFREVTGRMV